MPKFRRKPTEITAEQFTGEGPDPKGVYRMDAAITDVQDLEPIKIEANAPFVTTIHGQAVYLEPGDWIVPEPDGVHYYPVKNEIFRNTYEPVETEDAQEAAVSKVIAEMDREN